MLRRMRTTTLFFALALGLGACSDDSSTAGGGGGAGGAADGGGGSEEVEGCDGAQLLASPADTSQRGPWQVGARAVTIDGLPAEVWYPAAELGAAPATRVYDLRDFLPPAEAAKIADADAPRQLCDCYEDVPLDEAHGPYPLVIFVHGTAGYRAQSLELVTHWASRGFIVVAADHPGLYLGDLLTSLPLCEGEAPEQDLAGDLATIVAAFESPSGDLAGFAGRVDATRVGLVGHSAGGGAVGAAPDLGHVIVPMAAGGVDAGSAVTSALILGGLEDQVVPYTNQQEGFDTTQAATKRLVGLSPAGHLVFSSLCAITNDAGEDIVTVGTNADVCGLALAGALFDCDPSYVEATRGWTIVNDAISAALEETLHCMPERADRLATLAERYDEVAELR